MSSNRVTVYEAADQLGLSVDAIRKRVQRGSIPYEKDSSGRVHILLDESSTLHDVVQDSYETPSLSLIEELREQNAYLRTLLNTEREARTEENRRKDEENRRKDHIIAGLVQRIPELRHPTINITSLNQRGDGSISLSCSARITRSIASLCSCQVRCA